MARMLPAVKELAKKISDSEKKNKESQSLTGLAVFSSEVAKRYKSFSEFVSLCNQRTVLLLLVGVCCCWLSLVIDFLLVVVSCCWLF